MLNANIKTNRVCHRLFRFPAYLRLSQIDKITRLKKWKCSAGKNVETLKYIKDIDKERVKYADIVNKVKTTNLTYNTESLFANIVTTIPFLNLFEKLASDIIRQINIFDIDEYKLSTFIVIIYTGTDWMSSYQIKDLASNVCQIIHQEFIGIFFSFYFISKFFSLRPTTTALWTLIFFYKK